MANSGLNWRDLLFVNGGIRECSYSRIPYSRMVLKTLPLGVRMVVDEEALSAVTSAPELPHNKTWWFQKNDSRVDLWKNSFTLAHMREGEIDSLFQL